MLVPRINLSLLTVLIILTKKKKAHIYVFNAEMEAKLLSSIMARESYTHHSLRDGSIQMVLLRLCIRTDTRKPSMSLGE